MQRLEVLATYHPCLPSGTRTLPAGFSGSLLGRLPTGWHIHRTSRGAEYARNAEENVITVSDIRRSPVQAFVHKAIRDIRALVPGSPELYLEVASEGIKYYIVDDARRRVYWIGQGGEMLFGPTYRSSVDPTEVDAITHAIVIEYWNHVENHPYSRREDILMVEILRERLREGAAAAGFGTFDSEQCGIVIETLQGLLGASDAHQHYCTSAIARLWVTIAKVTFREQFGCDYRESSSVITAPPVNGRIRHWLNAYFPGSDPWATLLVIAVIGAVAAVWYQGQANENTENESYQVVHNLTAHLTTSVVAEEHRASTDA